ncbi:hypothetical protein [Halopseudomonas pelagia]|uniref:hypothetical protein n=1 Tax=Halopseudomonas pelagia TaxID=553151 RepID=UPI0003A8A02A|nr:hypothetical protein [Halopseudomonas pelagia]|tara:strand:+ start:713 stop:955 length:243 start_codon:yes stop_codon:yes gene_type:complete
MLISRLFKRQASPAHYFAQLDAHDNCLALWALDQSPDTGHWVQVTELNPHWLGRPLPRDARADLQAPTGQPSAIQRLISF